MPIEITIELPDDAFSVLRTAPDEFVKEMRLAAAVKWYEIGLVSQSKGAELAGMSREQFLSSLSRFHVSPVQEAPDELAKEVEGDLDIRFDCSGIDWNVVSETLKRVGMAYYAPDVHRKAFENSHTTVFVYLDDRLIGFGRAISDGAYQAAVYDVAVLPEYQRQGIGETIMRNIVSCLPQCNFILYAGPGKEDFYRKLGWRKMYTGMALFKKAEEMKRKGFTE